MTRKHWICVWLLALIPLLGFWTYGLFDLDEGIYAAALGEMLRNDEFLVITYKGAPFFEKPILIYWVAMAFLKLGIPGFIALRLGSFLSIVGLYWIVTKFCRKHFSDATAARTLLILASSPLIVGIGRMFMPDALFILFLTGAFLSFWESLIGSPRWRWVTGACLGFSALSKGPIAIVLFGLVFLTVIVLVPERRRNLRGGWLIGITLLLGVLCTWYLPIYLREGPQFVKSFILFQNIGRLQGADLAHRGPLYYYLPILLVGMVPFFLAIPALLKRAQRSDLDKYLFACVIIILGVFSIAGSKLPHYIAPMLPFMAILIAPACDRIKAYPAMIVGGVLAAALIIAPLSTEYRAFSVIGLAYAGLVTISMCVPYIRTSFANSAIALGLPLVGLLGLAGAPMYWNRSHGDLFTAAEAIRARNAAMIQFRMDGMGERLATSHPSLSWYLQTDTASSVWLDDLYRAARPGVLILTRRERLSKTRQDLLAPCLELARTTTHGEYQIIEILAKR